MPYRVHWLDSEELVSWVAEVTVCAWHRDLCWLSRKRLLNFVLAVGYEWRNCPIGLILVQQRCILSEERFLSPRTSNLSEQFVVGNGLLLRSNRSWLRHFAFSSEICWNGVKSAMDYCSDRTDLTWHLSWDLSWETWFFLRCENWSLRAFLRSDCVEVVSQRGVCLKLSLCFSQAQVSRS